MAEEKKPRTIQMLSKSEVSFSGGLDLNANEKASLGIDVISKIDINVSNPSKKILNGTKTMLIDSLNANPSIADEIELQEVINDKNKFYVLVSDVTYVDKTTITVNKNREGKTSFTSKALSSKGEIKVNIIDTASVKFTNDIAFVKYEVLRPYYNKKGNYAFSRVTKIYLDAFLKDLGDTY